MSKLSQLILLQLVFTIIYFARAWLHGLIASRRYGCKAARKRNIRDPIFGSALGKQDVDTSTKFASLLAGVALHAEYGHTFCETTIIRVTRLRTRDEENIRTMFSTQAAEWGVEPARLYAMNPFMGEGVLTKDGPFWEYSRAMLTPSFHTNNISNLGPFDHTVSQLLTKIPTDGSTIDMQPLLLLMFVDVSTRFALGKPIGVVDSSQSVNTLVEGMDFHTAFQLSLRSCGMRMAMGSWRAFLTKSAVSDHWKTIHRMVDTYIDDALKSKLSQTTGSHSVLNTIIQQTNDPLEIRNQVIQAMVAAQDTTPMLVSNTLFLLSRNPDIYAQLRSEISTLQLQTPSIEDIRQCKLLLHVIRESLRLYPPLPRMARVALNHTILPQGGGPKQQSPIYVQAGTRLVADFYALHRDESIYGPDVEKFVPDRWNTINPGPWQYMPFGGGKRACLGREKAIAEASCTIIRIVQKFSKIESRDDKDWAGDHKLAVQNINGCKVAFILA